MNRVAVACGSLGLPTACSYVALRHLIGMPILGLGVAALVGYRNRQRGGTGSR